MGRQQARFLRLEANPIGGEKVVKKRPSAPDFPRVERSYLRLRTAGASPCPDDIR